jgi:quinol monooxygenase YgiN
MTRQILSFAFLAVVALSGCTGPQGAQRLPTPDAPQNVFVVSHIDVMPDFAPATAQLLQQYEGDSRTENGALRFEVMVQDGRPNHFTIVEVWNTRQAFEAHTAQQHTRDFRTKLQPYLGSPYDERLHAVI